MKLYGNKIPTYSPAEYKALGKKQKTKKKEK